jgi:hypothetical protein
MIVVFDTNVWLSQLGLRSPAAAGVRFFLKQNKHRVGLPQVIRMEVEINLKRDLINSINDIKQSHEKLVTLFRKLPEVVLPSEEQVIALIPELFTSLGVEIIEVPFSMQSATSSFLKTIHKEAPSNNQQQFKDGVIWADCLGLLEQDDVTLVTKDAAFYAGGNYKNGLTANLRLEAKSRPHSINIVSDLSELLDKLDKTIRFDEVKLYKTLLLSAQSAVDGLFAQGFILGGNPRVTTKLFATEDTDKLFFDCSIELLCPDVSGAERNDAVLVIEADGLYSCANNSFDEISLQTSGYNFIDERGEEVKRRDVWIRARGAAFGHRETTSVTRHELNFPIE